MMFVFAFALKLAKFVFAQMHIFCFIIFCTCVCVLIVWFDLFDGLEETNVYEMKKEEPFTFFLIHANLEDVEINIQMIFTLNAN